MSTSLTATERAPLLGSRLVYESVIDDDDDEEDLEEEYNPSHPSYGAITPHSVDESKSPTPPNSRTVKNAISSAFADTDFLENKGNVGEHRIFFSGIVTFVLNIIWICILLLAE